MTDKNDKPATDNKPAQNVKDAAGKVEVYTDEAGEHPVSAEPGVKGEGNEPPGVRLPYDVGGFDGRPVPGKNTDELEQDNGE